MSDGTIAELLPISEEVLAWVERRRRDGSDEASGDDLRRIELCALATREIALFRDLYGDGRVLYEGLDETR